MSEGYEPVERRASRHETFFKRFNAFAFASIRKIADRTERLIVILYADKWMHFDAYGHLTNSMLDHQAEGRKSSENPRTSDAVRGGTAPSFKTAAVLGSSGDEWMLVEEVAGGAHDACQVCKTGLSLEYPGGAAAVGTQAMIHSECWGRLNPLQHQKSATSEACLECWSAPAAPGTELIKKADNLEDEYDLTEEVKGYYRQQFTDREKIRDEIGVDSMDTDVKVGENLRRRWVTDQATDPELHEDIQRLRKTKGVDDQFKRLKDGLLEVCVKSQYPGEPVIWVPYVPAGEVHLGESWRT